VLKIFLKQAIKFLLGEHNLNRLNKLKQHYVDRKGNLSYSQEGEDRVLSSLLFKLNGAKHINNGFYIDVGAHHPYRYSNTYLFYRQGWHGINIDAMPGSMAAFKNKRSRDINLECGIGLNKQTLKFFVFNEPAVNTFDEKLARDRCNNVWYIKDVVNVPVVTLSEVLNEHLLIGQKIDFLTVDVEGLDLDVLMSNDWEKYRPSVVLAETYGLSYEDLALDRVIKYMHSVGYVVYSKTVNTTFFVENSSV
jgi:FkbM family methyltransferase